VSAFAGHPVLTWTMVVASWGIVLGALYLPIRRERRRLGLGRWAVPTSTTPIPTEVAATVRAKDVARRALEVEERTGEPIDGRRPCRCGCPAAVHDHNRGGDDCGHCGRPICRSYRPDPRAVAQVVSPETVDTPAGDVEDTFAMWAPHADVNDLDLLARLTRENVRGPGISTN